MTSKQKNIGLVVGFVLVLVLSYQLAIAKTFEQKNQYKTLQQEVLLFENAPKQLSLLKQKQRYYDSILSSYQLDGSSIQNNLLSTINSYADQNSIEVISFLEPHSMDKNGLMVKTYDFTLEGDYNSIIGLIYKIEQKTKFGEVIHLKFEKKKNFRSGRYYLQARVLLKSFG